MKEAVPLEVESKIWAVAGLAISSLSKPQDVKLQSRLQQLPFRVQEKVRHPTKVDRAKVNLPTDNAHSDSALRITPVASRLANLLPAWQNITSDMYVLNVEFDSLHVEFDSGSPPLQQQVPPPIRFEDWEVHIIDQELVTLLRKGDC